MAHSAEQLKQEISEQYIKEFKEELWWLKSLALLPIEKKVKKILTWEWELPDKFNEVEEFWWWKDIINFITPELAQKILNFMKEKRLEIEKRKTVEELEALNNEILGIETPADTTEQQQDDQISQQDNQQTSKEDDTEETTTINEWNDNNSDHSSTVAWVLTSTLWVWATATMAKLTESARYKDMVEWLNADKIRWTINAGIEALNKQKNLDSRLTTHQINTINKHIAKLEQWIGSVGDDEIALAKLWSKFDNKLPKELVINAGLWESQLLKIEKIADKLSECKSIDEMKNLLRENEIEWISDGILNAFKEANGAEELKQMTKILRHGKRINRFLQTLSYTMTIDVACLWLDVFVYLESKKEAELIAKVNQLRAENKNNQANMQLWIAVWSVLLEAGIIGICTLAWSYWWPLWTAVWLAVWAISMVASMWVDAYYYDVNDFYLQNGEDFIRQKKSRVNQAILQWLHNKKMWNWSLNETIHEYANWAKWYEVALWCFNPMIGLWEAFVTHKPNEELREQKEASLWDACWSMLFLDEIENGRFKGYAPFYDYLRSGKAREDFVRDLNDYQKKEFNEKRREITLQIALRMEYVDKSFKWKKVIEELQGWNWMETLNNIVRESRIYWELKSEWNWNERTSFDTNLRRYKELFFSDFPKEKLEKIEKLKENNPLLYKELIVTTSLTSFLWEDEDDKTYTENVKLVHKYQEWLKLTQTDKEKINMEIPDIDRNKNFIEQLLRADFDPSKVKFPTISDNKVKYIIESNSAREGYMEVSDDPFQNTLYRLAKELFWYTWKNEKNELMEFYSEEEWNVHGIYFKDEWIINNDWAIDRGVKRASRTWKLFSSQAEVEQYINNFMARNMTGDSIDTPTEAIDDYLQKEFENRFRDILREELTSRTADNQKKVKKEISDFVKQHAKNGKYIEIPYFLLVQARKAGLWDLQRQFFRRKDWKLEVCMFPSELKTNTMDAKVTYLSPSREEFTEEEKVYIDRVEKAHADVENLRNLWWTWFLTDTFSDELDLPKEIEILISDKYKEWEKFKSDVLMLSASSASSIWIYEKYKEYAEYFENLYRGILLALTTYSMSNDVDSYALFSNALSMWNNNYFNEDWTIRSNVEVEFLRKTRLKKFYNDQIAKQTVAWKTIKELRKSERLPDRELWFQASKIIITTILEESMLSKDKDWKITNIHIGNHWFDSDTNDGYEDKKYETEMIIEDKLKQIWELPEIKQSEIDKLSKHQSIKPLKEKDEKVVKEVPELQKKIESRRDDVVWQWKRWNIEYNPEKWTLKSWWQEVKIEEKNGKYFIEGFNHTFTDVKVMLWVANFRNWAKAKFPWKTIVYDWDLFSSSWWFRYSLVAKEPWPKSDTSLIPRYSLEVCFPACKDDEVLKAFAEWINKEVNK